jgi:hypothetical protein
MALNLFTPRKGKAVEQPSGNTTAPPKDVPTRRTQAHLKIEDYRSFETNNFSVSLTNLKALNCYDHDRRGPYPKIYTKLTGEAHAEAQELRVIGTEARSNKFDLVVHSDAFVLQEWEDLLKHREVMTFDKVSEEGEYKEHNRLHRIALNRMPTFPPTPFDPEKHFLGVPKPPTAVVHYYASCKEGQYPEQWFLTLYLPDELYRTLWSDVKNGTTSQVHMRIEWVFSGNRYDFTDEGLVRSWALYSLGTDCDPEPLLGWIADASWSQT